MEEIMAYPPFLSFSEAEGLGTGEEKDAPTMKHAHGFFGCHFLLKNGYDFRFSPIEVFQPALGCLGVMFTGPTPACFQFQLSRNPEK